MKQIVLPFLLGPALLLAAGAESPTIARLRAKAEQGVPGAQFNLAEMYASGYGVSQDPASAAGWYHKSAEQGYGEAQFSLAMAYLEGRGINKDATEGLAWVVVAARAGGARLAKFRDQLEQQLGPGAAAAAHKRSQELLAVIDARKRTKSGS